MGRVLAGFVLVLFGLLVLLPALVVKGCGAAYRPPSEGQASPARVERPVRVYLTDEDRVVVMDLEEYVKGVVAAEMPAAFELEALKAQAVIARTYAVRRVRRYGGTGCPGRVDADLCTSAASHQAWTSRAALADRWGEDFDTLWQRIEQATEATRGIILVYGGVPIDPVYHSTSGGHTAAAEDVWGDPVPYLRPVPSPGEEEAPRYRAVVGLSLTEVESKLGLAPDTLRRAAAAGQPLFRVVEASGHGRARAVEVAGKLWRGTDFRSALGLNSAWFTWRVSGDRVTFTTRGYGHGVGLSQYGANAMARAGKTYEAILAHYYRDVTLEPLFDD